VLKAPGSGYIFMTEGEEQKTHLLRIEGDEARLLLGFAAWDAESVDR